MNDQKVTVGQVLYEPPMRAGGDYRDHKVVKIGRKWITLNTNKRCSLDGLMLDCGGYSPRKLYADKQAHKDESMRGAAWRDLVRDVYNMRQPDGMDIEAINEIRRKLRLNVLGEAV